MPIDVLDPRVTPEPLRPFAPAPRPAALAGIRLGLLDNGKRNSARVLEHLAAAMGRQYALAEVILRTKPSSSTGVPEALLAELKAGCDAVVAGIGD